jgi:ABC-type multidrug transport system fused ATPase/permease subunit
VPKNRGLNKKPIFRALSLISINERRKLVFALGLQILIGLMDLLGVFAIGLLGILSISNNSSIKTNSVLIEIYAFLPISSFSQKEQIILLSISSVLLLSIRTMFSIYFTKRILRFFSLRSVTLSQQLLSKVLSQSYPQLQTKTPQDLLFSVTRGVEYIALQVLAPAVVLIADSSLVLIMLLGLFFLDPITACLIMSVFLTIGFTLYKFLHKESEILGSRYVKYNVKSNEKILQVFETFRELVVRGRREFYLREIGEIRTNLAVTTSRIYFMPYVSKYVIETSVIIAGLLIGATQFIFADPNSAIGTLTVFLAAGTRMTPAILRVQQGALQIRSSLGQATSTLELFESLEKIKSLPPSSDVLEFLYSDFKPEIYMENITFTYLGSTTPSLSAVNLQIVPGTFVAIVGPSGSGKTTLMNLLLGLTEPDLGKVTVSGVSPADAISSWPGAISFVPQDVAIFSGSILENVALGFQLDSINLELVMRALRFANLEKFIDSLPNGIMHEVGERGSKLSGGQRQRLGIARAMFTNPKLLILDEATSALDTETEQTISQEIHDLSGAVTIVTIAHRLSTVKNADLVLYLSEGKIMASGTFDEVRNLVPNFDKQANLMGL